MITSTLLKPHKYLGNFNRRRQIGHGDKLLAGRAPSSGRVGPFVRKWFEGHVCVSSPGHLEESAGQALRKQTDLKRVEPDVERISSYYLT